VAPRRQTAQEVEAEVQRRLPHVRLADDAQFESKGYPALWFCTRHAREFRASGSSLVREKAVGCPDCLEERASERRKMALADPNLDQNLATIRAQLDDAHAEIYRLRCAGKKLAEIGGMLGGEEDRAAQALKRIRAALAKTE
jgi:hypothetical protein